MGLAPGSSLTGLWMGLCGLLEFFAELQPFLITSFLLDKAPLNFVWHILDSSVILPLYNNLFLTGDFSIFGQFGRVARTTTRSQVRATRISSGRWFSWRLLVLLLTITTSVQWSEGCAGSMDSAGASWTSLSGAKEHAEELQIAFEHAQTNFHHSVKKRSYKRAVKRAEIHGFTLYRGRLCSAHQLGTSHKSPPHDVVAKPNITQNHKLKRKRITCFSWNSSGLSPSGWDFFQQWIACQRLDVVMIQETHWGYTSEWIMEHYYALHSGVGAGRAGLLCLISKDLCQMHDLSWHEISPGRLMHFRIHGRDRDLDFINIYQHIHVRDRMDDRQTLWTELQTLLTKLPKRNHLTIMGDWNTSLGTSSTAVGVETYRWQMSRSRGPKHTDAHVFQHILTQFDLFAINTWDSTLGPTYIFGDQTSRIDFVICRRQYSDETSKHVQYLDDFPLNCPTGAHHLPQIASLLKVWHQNFTESPTGWTRAQRLELHRQWTRNPGAADKLHADIRETIDALPRDGNRFDHVHDALNSFQAPQTHQKREEVCKYDITPFQLFQAHSHHLRDLRQPTLGNIFQAWFHAHHRQRARKIQTYSNP